MSTCFIYTPARGHMQGGRESGCPRCGETQADWAHFILLCPEKPCSDDLEEMPHCIPKVMGP